MTSEKRWLVRVLSMCLAVAVALPLAGFTGIGLASASPTLMPANGSEAVDTDAMPAADGEVSEESEEAEESSAPGGEPTETESESESESESEPPATEGEEPEVPTDPEPPVTPSVVGTTPEISGTVRVGQKLTVVAGQWTAGASLSYQWLRDGKVISGATSSTYSLVAADEGRAISVAVTGALAGYNTTALTSAATTSVALGKLTTAKPTISGTRAVGKKLTSKRGTWTSGTKFTYQWLRDGKKISGATKSTYTLVAADKGKRITVTVTGTLTGYAKGSSTSAKTAVIAAGKLSTGKPTISGTRKVGKKLTAKRGTWTSGTKFTYQWLRNGTRIPGATKSTYTLTIADRGKNISVRVRGTKAGYASRTRLSANTVKIGRRALNTTTSSSIHVLVNKKNPLRTLRYAPNTVALSSFGVGGGERMQPDAAKAMGDLVRAARNDGIYITVISGYRSYDMQSWLFNDYVRRSGRAAAESFSARPGYSEHQTGLAADISSPWEACDLAGCFAYTRAAKWAANNAWKYGYIVRYPAGKTSTTGYIYEPWHLRYVGKAVAKDMRDGGYVTYEAYLGKKAAPTY